MCSTTSSGSTTRLGGTRRSATSAQYSSNKLKELRSVSRIPAAAHLLVRQAAMFGQLMAGARQALCVTGRDAQRHGQGREAPGLVSVSTTCRSGDINRFDITGDRKLTSDLMAPMISASYQFDYRLISCPTPSGSGPTLKQQPASGPQPSASASMPSSAFVSMPTSTAQASPPRKPALPGRPLKASDDAQGSMKPSSRPLQIKPLTTTGNRSDMTRSGSSSIQTPRCGPGMTRSPHGTVAEMKSSAKTGTTPASNRSNAIRASLRPNTGPRGSVPPMQSQDASWRKASGAASVEADAQYQQIDGGR
ncbi:hypothetical protein Dtpsy_1865 [[Acidovorax] ebreus TPSY]|uniref:Uncharacterized protein n=1 Tax=Acidovorax ebreus (strain TPSY) TaxID=535289 RepID=A0A9J9QBF9_ACIET|nr:hypothetical protein Dtpsy_1865 [[Acidovorax] ebreus TPSY]